MSTNTSSGPTEGGGNEDHGNADGLGNKTLGDHAAQQPPAGSGLPEEDEAEAPAGVSGSGPRPGIEKAKDR
jgi:hypothetical protein